MKVNMHNQTFQIAFPNGNTLGVGLILKNSIGLMIKGILGTVLGVSPLYAQLYIMLIGMRRPFREGAKKVIIETDNLEAFAALKYYKLRVPAEVEHVVEQIDRRKKDHHCQVIIHYVYSRWNIVSTYMADIGAKHLNGMVTVEDPVGKMAELIDLDMGFGLHHHTLNEVEIRGDELYALNQAVVAAEGGAPVISITQGFLNDNGINVYGDGFPEFVAEEELEAEEFPNDGGLQDEDMM